MVIVLLLSRAPRGMLVRNNEGRSCLDSSRSILVMGAVKGVKERYLKLNIVQNREFQGLLMQFYRQVKKLGNGLVSEIEGPSVKSSLSCLLYNFFNTSSAREHI